MYVFVWRYKMLLVHASHILDQAELSINSTRTQLKILRAARPEFKANENEFKKKNSDAVVGSKKLVHT